MTARVLLAAVAASLAACSHPTAPEIMVPPPKAPGYLGHACAGMALYVSSGNAKGKCVAELDDQTRRLTRMGCDDGHGNNAELTCAVSGEIECQSSGFGLCTTDEAIVQPATQPPLNAIASRCGGVAYFVSGKRCIAKRDSTSGAVIVHCDDTHGNSAEYACRDDKVACTSTGDGECHP
jgi:hypothetical protein